jgi:hypothetical protein
MSDYIACTCVLTIVHRQSNCYADVINNTNSDIRFILLGNILISFDVYFNNFFF